MSCVCHIHRRVPTRGGDSQEAAVIDSTVLLLRCPVCHIHRRVPTRGGDSQEAAVIDSTVLLLRCPVCHIHRRVPTRGGDSQEAAVIDSTVLLLRCPVSVTYTDMYLREEETHKKLLSLTVQSYCCDVLCLSHTQTFTYERRRLTRSSCRCM